MPIFALALSVGLVASTNPLPSCEPPTTLSQNPADDELLAWTSDTDGAQALDRQRGWLLAVGPDGLRVRPTSEASGTDAASWEFAIGTSSFGLEGAQVAVKPGQPVARGARVDLDHGGLTEWFVRGEHGVEHGWTIPAAPEGNLSKPLWIGLRIAGDLSVHITDDGSGAFLRDARGVLRLRYGFLKTYDATGAVIPSRLSPSPWGVGIEVDATDAAFPITIDPLVTAAAWTFETDQVNGSGTGAFREWLMGAPAGDVDGDGFSDILVGAHMFDGPNGADEGRVWLFRGGPIGPSLAPDWYVDGGVVGGQFGGAVSSIGDVNRDGFDDIGVLAYAHGVGRLYVWLGSAAGLGPSGLNTSSADFTYAGAGDTFGMYLHPVGDLNGDGYDDFTVSSYREDNGATTDAGAAYVFFGSASGPTSSPWIKRGTQALALFGTSAGAGDVNGDGYSDLVVGESNWDGASSDEGRVHLFLGGPSFATDFASDWTYSGGGGSLFGFRAVGAGDANGDGFSDVMVSAIGASNGQPGEGVVYAFYGQPGGLGATTGHLYESNTVSGAWGGDLGPAGDIDGDGFGDFVIGSNAHFAAIVHGRAGGLVFTGGPGDQSLQGTTTDHFGFFANGAGDVNGDGFCDVVFTARDYSGPESHEGRVIVHFGSPNPQTTGAPHPLIELGTPASGSASSRTGRSVSSAGDVNADGFNDVIVGSPEFGATDNGRVQVFLGSANGLNLTSPFWTFDSPNTGENFGWSVSAGDVDNDGKSDIVVGAPKYANGQVDEGRVYLFRSLGGSISATPTWSHESNEAGALLGSAVTALGDVNADGLSDIAAGAPGATSGQGTVTIFHGRATGLASITPAITITSGVAGSGFGTSLALVGDLNLDGFGDLAVGAPSIDNPQVDEGRVYVYLGSYTGISNTVAGQEESQQAGAMLGSSIAQCGDVNGDGRAEVLVGAPGYDAATAGGGAFLYQAQPAGAGITLTALAVRAGAQPNSQYGLAVSAGGDVNGDGWNDVLVGAPDYDGSLSNQGRIYLYLGSSSGLAASPSETYDGPIANARLGESIALGGDVNGDGLSDPIGGVPSANNDDGGVIPLVAGGNTAWRVSTTQRQVGDLQAVQLLGRSSDINQFQVNLGVQLAGGNTATAMGRAPVKLEWEIQQVGSILDGSAIQEQMSFVDSGALGSGLRLSQNLTGLVDGQAYHWRARTVVRNPYYPHTRWTTIQLDGLQEKKLGLSADCNNNGIGDTIDLAQATSLDCNADSIPDECQVPPLGNTFADCNANLVPDPCEYDPLFDCDSNGVLDECQIPPFGNQDCNANSVVDACDIAGGSSLDSNADGVPDECQQAQMAASTFCYGDGTGTACPCGNSSPVGNEDGCLNSLGLGGRLRATGIARVQAPFDNFRLFGTGMPNSSALYFQGTTQQSSGNGAVFGDGKRCAAGSVVRLATKNNTGGGSQYPAVGDIPISIKGLIPAGGGTRYYQCWYRNAAAFCTVSTFNLSNGFRVTWIP